MVKQNNRMKKLISKEDAYEILKGHLQTINSTMSEALDSLNITLLASDETLSKSVKAQMFHGVCTTKIKKAFSKIECVQIIEKYNSLSLIFNQQVVARVKKINKNDLSSGNTTKRSNQIADQTYKLFPEIKDFTFVDLGYNVDLTWTEFEKLTVVCRLKKDIQWRIPFGEIEVEKTLKAIPAELGVSEEQIKIKKKHESV